jgi:hypothetical protein
VGVTSCFSSLDGNLLIRKSLKSNIVGFSCLNPTDKIGVLLRSAFGIALFIENERGNPEIFGLVGGKLPPTHSSRPKSTGLYFYPIWPQGKICQ